MKRKNGYFLCLLLLAVVSSCTTVGQVAPPAGEQLESLPRILLNIRLAPASVEITGGRVGKDNAVPPPSSDRRAVRWELLRPDGSIVESGFAEDDRWLFWDTAGPDGKIIGGSSKGDSGSLDFDVPAVAGMIRVVEPDGKEIGRVDFNPGRWLDDAADGGHAGSPRQRLSQKRPDKGTQLAALRFGPRMDELGDPNDRNGGGQPAFGVDDDGRVFLLDSGKGRVVRLAGDGSFDGGFPVDGQGEAGDLVVEGHGKFAVFFAAGSETRVVLHDEKGVRRGDTLLLPGYGPPYLLTREYLWAWDKRGDIHPLWDGKRLMAEDERHRLGLPGLPRVFPGPPRELGAVAVSIASNRVAEAKVFDGKGRVAMRTTLEVPAPLLDVPVLAPLLDDDLVIIFELQRIGYLAVRLDAQLQITAFINIEARRHPTTPARKLAVDGQGRIYQLIPGKGGIEVRVHRFPDS